MALNDKVLTDAEIANRETAVKALFLMVYQWGRAGVVADESAPAFQRALKKVLKYERD